MYCKILLPLSLGAFHRKLRLVLLRDTNLGGAGLSGSQDFVKNDTVSLAPPRIWLGPISVNAWIRMWYSVHGLKSVSLHSIYRVKKINICLLILACFKFIRACKLCLFFIGICSLYTTYKHTYRMGYENGPIFPVFSLVGQ